MRGEKSETEVVAETAGAGKSPRAAEGRAPSSPAAHSPGGGAACRPARPPGPTARPRPLTFTRLSPASSRSC